MFAPENTGGDDVTSYELYVDSGVIYPSDAGSNRNVQILDSDFTKVQTYADAGGDIATLLQHSVTVVDDLLEEGKIYTFKFRSSNTIGWSVYTEFLRVGISARIQAPQNLNANLTLATATTQTLIWDEVVPDLNGLVTEGYVLEQL